MGRWPFGLLGALAAVLVVELALTRFEADLRPLVVSDWGMAREEATREATRARILCLGDSLVKCGIVPEVVEAGTGRSTFNLSIIGAPTPATLFLLERSLASGARPEALVIDASPTTLSAFEFDLFARNWSVLLGPREALRLAHDCRDSLFYGLYVVNRFVPSVRMRLDVRDSIARFFGLTAEPAVPWASIVARQHAINRGAFHRPPNHEDIAPDPYEGGKLPKFEERVCYPKDWAPNWVNLMYLGRILQLAESRGLQVFFLIPPIHPGVQAVREDRGLDRPYTELVRKIEGRYRNVIVIDGRHAGYGHALFADSHHLTSRGAVAYSEAVARVVSERLGHESSRTRWVELPRFAEATARPAIEDLDQSQLAVSAGRGLR